MIALIIFRLGLGALFLLAAGLKFYGLGTSSLPEVDLFGDPWLQLFVAEWEAFLGLWLFSGRLLKISWFASVATLASFSTASGYLAYLGSSSCGCLGAVHTSPWWVLAVDISSLVVLFATRKTWTRISPTPKNQTALGSAAMGVVLFLVASIASSAVYGSPASAVARLRGDSLTATGLDLGQGKSGEVIEGAITVRNLSDRPIRIVGGQLNCSCGVVTDMPLSIEPGATVPIGIQMRLPSKAKLNTVARTISLLTDDPNRPLFRFRVTCRIDPS